MKDLSRRALDTAASRGASYADVRAIEVAREDIQVKNGEVGGMDLSDSAGLGVRVLVQGAWGFAATDDLTQNGADRCAGEAVAIARASASLEHEPVRLAPEPAHRAVWASTCAIDPFQVPLEKKLDLLFRIDAEMRSVRGVKNAESFLAFQRKKQHFLSTEGSDIEQTMTRSGGGFAATAVSDEDVQRRSFPQAEGFHQALGYEFIEATPYVQNARRIAEESVALLTAEQCPAGERDIILEGSQLALQIHESVGHPTELDRVLGYEANFAGTSFVTLDKWQSGNFKYGSDKVTIFADKVQPHTLGAVGYDDEGVKTQRWDLIKDGVLVNYQAIRDQAHILGLKASQGCCYADNWANVQFQRMANVSLAPGKDKQTAAEMIKNVENGIYIIGDGSFSIDQQRYNAQFGGQLFYEIKGGKIVGQLKDVAYQIRTPDFWNSLDMIGGKKSYEMGASFFDGKGQPGQVNAVSHGCVPSRFRNVNVINTGRKS